MKQKTTTLILGLHSDTPQDYALLCSVYDKLYDKNEFFSLDDILELFSSKPYLKDINSEITQKKGLQ